MTDIRAKDAVLGGTMTYGEHRVVVLRVDRVRGYYDYGRDTLVFTVHSAETGVRRFACKQGTKLRDYLPPIIGPLDTTR